jgi:methylenetetrahydrofolate reductase (NADPH)
MGRIVDLLGRPHTVSIELWPPRTPKAEAHLEAAIAELEPLRPLFTSITYGAGGSTRERTHELVVRLQEEGKTVPMAHLVCAAHSRAELREILERYAANGVENILALRGDPPLESEGDLPAGELTYAAELVELAKEVADFCVAVAAHPNGHPDSPDRDSDLDYLARKLGLADFAITQFLFSADDYLRLVDDLAEQGCGKPILPGVMPITNPRTVMRMAEMAGAPVPAGVIERVALGGDDPAEVRRIGVGIATELCGDLLAAGAPGLHFYTMNQSAATIEVCANLGICPETLRGADAG